MPRALEQTIHAVGQQGVPARLLFTDWRSQIVTLFNGSTAKYEFGMHLMREFNRRAKIAGFEDLMFTPYNSGFAFTGQTVAAIGGGGGGGGDVPITEDWVETSDAPWTSFTANGTGGFTGTSNGTSVAIIPQDIAGDTANKAVEFTFNIDTLSSGSVEFAVTEDAGSLTVTGTDVGTISKVTGGTKRGARAIFTTTGAKVVLINLPTTAKKRRATMHTNASGSNIVISGFTTLYGTVDVWTDLFGHYNFNAIGTSRGGITNNYNPAERFIQLSSNQRSIDGVVDAQVAGGMSLYEAFYPQFLNTFVEGYVSDFTAGLDGWTATELTTAFNQTVAGKTGCVTMTGIGSITTGHWLTQGATFPSTGYASGRFWVYINPNNVSVDGFRIRTQSGNNIDGATHTSITKGVWHFVTVESAFLATGWRIVPTIAGVENTAIPVTDSISIVDVDAYVAPSPSTWPTMGLGRSAQGRENFTFATWFRTKDYTAGAFILAQHNQASTSTSQRSILLQQVASGAVQWNIRSSLGTYFDVDSPAAVIANDTWYHIMVTYEAGVEARMYINGVEVAAGPTSLAGVSLLVLSTETTRFNKIGSVVGANMALDDCCFYDTVKNSAHANALYAAGVGMNEAAMRETKVTSSLVETYQTDMVAAWSLADIGSLITNKAQVASYQGLGTGELRDIARFRNASEWTAQKELNDHDLMLARAASSGGFLATSALVDRTGNKRTIQYLTYGGNEPRYITSNVFTSNSPFTPEFLPQDGLGVPDLNGAFKALNKKMTFAFTAEFNNYATTQYFFSRMHQSVDGWRLMVSDFAGYPAVGSGNTNIALFLRNASVTHAYYHKVLGVDLRADGTPRVFIVQWEIASNAFVPASFEVYVNNTVIGSTVVATPVTGNYADDTTNNNIVIGARTDLWAGSRVANFQLGSFIVWNKILTADERADVTARLAALHSIEI